MIVNVESRLQSFLAVTVTVMTGDRDQMRERYLQRQPRAAVFQGLGEPLPFRPYLEPAYLAGCGPQAASEAAALAVTRSEPRRPALIIG